MRSRSSFTSVLSTFIFEATVSTKTRMTAPKPQQIQSRNARLNTSVSRRFAAIDMAADAAALNVLPVGCGAMSEQHFSGDRAGLEREPVARFDRDAGHDLATVDDRGIDKPKLSGLAHQ